jgi:hypothetical protein
MAMGPKPLEPSNRTGFGRVLDVLEGIDILYVVVILAGAVGWGAWIVGGWIVEAWRSGAWWSFILLTSMSALLLGGLAWELRHRRLGAFVLVTVGVSFLLGVGRVSDWLSGNP